VLYEQSQYQIKPDLFEANALGEKESGRLISYVPGRKVKWNPGTL
jgi:hypothetical protein